MGAAHRSHAGQRRRARAGRGRRWRCSTAGRRASPNRTVLAAGRSTSGSSKRCCCRSGSTTTSVVEGGAAGAPAFDKVPSKFAGWGENRFRDAGFRVVPGAVARRGSLHRPRRGADAQLRQHRRLCRRRDDGRYLGHGRQLRADRQERPHFGRRRDRRRARAAAGGSGGDRGRLLHRRALRSGRRRRVGRGAVLSMGVFIGASTKIVDRATGEVHRRAGPALFGGGARASCPASRCPTARPGPALYCAVIVKTVDAQTRAKTAHQRTAARLTDGGGRNATRGEP